eukprot:CAMPEP_0117683936 /NCGR_PEP_ID=MMETSP0804-20121206/20755_1 /TAXON_ID=1074897 /ORGANISM="Tetraselmis astigmatica, Strain CCMP880" /LENGTH=74 /DNA_ID=CAMNT_0005494741 /DNA_START=1366 /DNA_END=1588 /DNA_ORIENTATION=+
MPLAAAEGCQLLKDRCSRVRGLLNEDDTALAEAAEVCLSEESGGSGTPATRPAWLQDPERRREPEGGRRADDLW